MAGKHSAAMTLLLPAGAASDPVDRTGAATVLADLVLRGAGSRDNKTLTDYLDSLGLQRSSGVGVHHTRFGCAAVAPQVVKSLEVYSDIVRRPHMPADGFEAARDLSLQALAGLEDEPRQKVLIKLREWHWPSPYGRNTMGTPEHLQKLTLDLCKADFNLRYHAKDSILSLAGNIDFDEVKASVEKYFGDWDGQQPEAIK